ncbi:MAG TPA: hypothetical protein VGM81_08785 [Burkholderiaceae bacterium]|jgi:hypothetical protein
MPTAKEAPNRFHSWLSAALVLALTLYAQPYFGIRHDGVLYLGQVLNRLWPQALAHDLFFAHGSQDNFSIYSLSFAPLYKLFSSTTVQMTTLVLSQLASLTALFRLLRGLNAPKLAWSGLLAAAVMQHIYGGTGAFGFGETFLTARTLAEPLALWGLACCLERRWPRGCSLLVLSALFHPLMALPVMAVAWLLACRTDKRWLALLLLILPILALAWMGIGPAAALFKRYDPRWWALVKEVNELVALQNWTAEDWQSILADAAVLWGAWRLLPAPLSRLAGCTLVVAAAMLAVAGLGCDLLHNELLTQLQVWRVLWLVRALAVVCMPALLWTLWRSGRLGPMFALSAGLALTACNLRWPVGIPVLLVWTGLHAMVWYRHLPISRWLIGLSMGASLVGIFGLGLMMFLRLVDSPVDEVSNLSFGPLGTTLICWPLPALCATAWLLNRPLRARWQQALMALVVGLSVLCAALQWDHRSAFGRALEAGLTHEHPFSAWIPPHAQVYWHDQFGASWLLLHRASYYGKGQGAGLLFNQGTANEYGPRWEAFRAIRQQRTRCEASRDLMGVHPGDTPCWALSESQVREVCVSEHELDFVVAPELYSKPPLSRWAVPDADQDPKTQYLYACSQFR